MVTQFLVGKTIPMVEKLALFEKFWSGGEEEARFG